MATPTADPNAYVAHRSRAANAAPIVMRGGLLSQLGDALATVARLTALPLPTGNPFVQEAQRPNKRKNSTWHPVRPWVEGSVVQEMPPTQPPTPQPMVALPPKVTPNPITVAKPVSDPVKPVPTKNPEPKPQTPAPVQPTLVPEPKKVPASPTAIPPPKPPPSTLQEPPAPVTQPVALPPNTPDREPTTVVPPPNTPDREPTVPVPPPPTPAPPQSKPVQEDPSPPSPPQPPSPEIEQPAPVQQPVVPPPNAPEPTAPAPTQPKPPIPAPPEPSDPLPPPQQQPPAPVQPPPTNDPNAPTDPVVANPDPQPQPQTPFSPFQDPQPVPNQPPAPKVPAPPAPKPQPQTPSPDPQPQDPNPNRFRPLLVFPNPLRPRATPVRNVVARHPNRHPPSSTGFSLHDGTAGSPLNVNPAHRRRTPGSSSSHPPPPSGPASPATPRAPPSVTSSPDATTRGPLAPSSTVDTLSPSVNGEETPRRLGTVMKEIATETEALSAVTTEGTVTGITGQHELDRGVEERDCDDDNGGYLFEQRDWKHTGIEFRDDRVVIGNVNASNDNDVGDVDDGNFGHDKPCQCGARGGAWGGRRWRWRVRRW
ncbi:hypothetical protein HDU96_006923 [Phlyctochytrium bullatum]|nr:hypothetical protein HDU96_006923 [Phlyctochytrium bullatum]